MATPLTPAHTRPHILVREAPLGDAFHDTIEARRVHRPIAQSCRINSSGGPRTHGRRTKCWRFGFDLVACVGVSGTQDDSFDVFWCWYDDG